MLRGTNQENYDYVRKQSKWADDKKGETNLLDTFEECGELPPDRDESTNQSAVIYEIVKQGASNYEILEAFPNAMIKIDKIERARQTILEEQHKRDFSQLEVTYI